jgi:histone deacetylase HOS3
MPEPSYSKPTNQSNRRLSLISNSSATSEAPLPNGHNRVPSYSRPATSQTVRPDSSMSSRGHSIPPVVVKKTRAPAQPRGEAKTSRVRKKSPLNEGGAVTLESTSTAVPQRASSDTILPSTETSGSQMSDIDSLTSGMKKIKLNLTTKAQREAKEQVNQAAKPVPKPVAIKPKPRPTETRILPPVALPASTNGSSAPAPQTQSSGMLPPVPATPQHYLPAHVQQAAEIPLPASSPPGPSHPELEQGPPISQPSLQLASHPAPKSELFVHYQPEGPQPESMIQQEPLKWLPPNTSTPSPMKRGDLPVFTSKGVIPFGLPKINGDVKKEENREKEADIWEVPETPKK